MEVAIDNHVESLVIGILGWNLNGTPLDLVAAAFRYCFHQDRYAHAFRNIAFAIPEDECRSEFERIVRGE